MKLFVYGFGFIGSAFARLMGDATVITTARDPAKRDALMAQDITAHDPETLSHIDADAVLITLPPDSDGCPAFRQLTVRSGWIGYLSTTGVYGDRDGGWVDEQSALIPTSEEGRRRVVAEQQWLSRGACLFRLPGLYGPGRNVVERLRAGDARRIVRPDHVFSRLHHDDCATALRASVERPRAGGIYNLCDDAPASAEAVLLHACALTGLTPPAPVAWDDPEIGPKTRRFYNDNKRVSNARAKAELGWALTYPTYREGLTSLAAAGEGRGVKQERGMP